MVRMIACTVRGDASADILLLKAMPSISIDLPMTRHGYDVKADEVFWVSQGILRSTDLRDSMDEQYIADIAACVVTGALIERSKDALDQIYVEGSSECDSLLSALEVYGHDKFASEFKFCVDEILKVADVTPAQKLRDIVFSKKTSNAFPSVFAALVLAFHELIVKEQKKIADYDAVKKAITNLSDRIDTGRRATAPDERRKNINTVKGLVSSSFIKGDSACAIYGNHTTMDIEATIRRSEIELADYELKQGLLTLGKPRTADPNILDKVVKTICAIANNGPHTVGKLIIGVTDKEADADRIKKLDGIEPRKVGKRFVVGVNREASALGEGVESYFSRWKNSIKNSTLSEKLRNDVLSHMDFNSFYGLGIIVITIQGQTELSFVGDALYWRNGDSTERATSPKQIASLAKRF